MVSFASSVFATAATAVSINPTAVSKLLSETEDEWIHNAVVGLVAGTPGTVNVAINVPVDNKKNVFFGVPFEVVI